MNEKIFRTLYFPMTCSVKFQVLFGIFYSWSIVFCASIVSFLLREDVDLASQAISIGSFYKSGVRK